MANFFLYSALFILLGILAILSLVFSIVYFASSKKGKFIWLGTFVLSAAGFVFFFLFVDRKIDDKVSEFKNDFKNNTYNNLLKIDTTSFEDYNFADSLNSTQIKWLKQNEPAKFAGKVPEQFYNYLGFRDYYRLPLRYPFSLHCIDSPDKGWLYNEINVKKFDESDNGEMDCQLNNIEAFTFDKNYLVAEYYDETKKTKAYFIYHFNQHTVERFKYSDEVKLKAKKLGFTGDINLTTCKDYYNSL